MQKTRRPEGFRGKGSKARPRTIDPADSGLADRSILKNWVTTFRKYAAEQHIAGEKALKKRSNEKFCEFSENGSELYAKA